MALSVACLVRTGQRRSRIVAEAMCEGIRRCGDKPQVCAMWAPAKADVAFSYGWKHRARFKHYPAFVYADLGYWQRDSYYRLSVGGWGPEGYVCAGLPRSRFTALGLEIKPWNSGTEVIVAGSTQKAATDHGMAYMEWERRAIKRLISYGLNPIYRPKPNDPNARPIESAGYDHRPISEALRNARVWVTHHSNSAVDALLAGVPVHCEIGAAAALSMTFDQIPNAPRREGREAFLADVAWLQWTLDEMRTGEPWMHLKERGLLC